MPHDKPVPTAGSDIELVAFTTEGGLAILLTNKTGGASVRGTAVTADTTTDNAFKVTAADGYDCLGFVYDNDVADGGECWVVVSGIAQCLLDDADSAVHGDWARISAATAGRITTSAAPSPPTDATHFREIGHVIESKSSGTNVLVKVAIHFL